MNEEEGLLEGATSSSQFSRNMCIVNVAPDKHLEKQIQSVLGEKHVNCATRIPMCKAKQVCVSWKNNGKAQIITLVGPCGFSGSE